MGLFDAVRSLFSSDSTEADDDGTDSATTETTSSDDESAASPDIDAAESLDDTSPESADTDAPDESADAPESSAEDSSSFEEFEPATSKSGVSTAEDDEPVDDADDEPTDDEEPISWEETGFEQLTTELVDDEEEDDAEASPGDLIEEAEPDRDDDEPMIEEAEPTESAELATDDSADDDGLLAGASGDVGMEDTDDADVDVPEDSQRAEFLESATELVEFWGEYDLDYSVQSLVRLDDLIAEQWGPERFEDVEYGGEDYDSEVYTEVVTQVGSYVGEVFVREHDGEWVEESAVGWIVDVPAGPDSSVDGATVTVFHLAQRCLSGEATVAGKHDGLAAELDLSPTAGVEAEPTDIGPSTESADDDIDDTEIADRLQDSAEDLAERWPDYDLDFSAGSLSRLAALIDAEIASEEFADTELGDETDRASMLLTAHAVGIGGYLAAVLRREYGAEWDTEQMAIVVDGTTIAPIDHAADCIRGTASISDVVPE